MTQAQIDVGTTYIRYNSADVAWHVNVPMNINPDDLIAALEQVKALRAKEAEEHNLQSAVEE